MIIGKLAPGPYPAHFGVVHSTVLILTFRTSSISITIFGFLLVIVLRTGVLLHVDVVGSRVHRCVCCCCCGGGGAWSRCHTHGGWVWRRWRPSSRHCRRFGKPSPPFGLGLRKNNAKGSTSLVIDSCQFIAAHQAFQFFFDLTEAASIPPVYPVTDPFAVGPGFTILEE